MKKIQPYITSYNSPKLKIKKSKINGLGFFANSDIKKNEIVLIKGGHIVNHKELFASQKISSYIPLGKNYFIGAISPKEEPYTKLCINHSCNPNCCIRGEITFIATKNIKKGEELTIDYATIDDENYSFKCNCKSTDCRKIITGKDWKIPNLQQKYKNFFARYLQDKIDLKFKK